MGDSRFTAHYEEVLDAKDPIGAIHRLTDDGVIAALADASHGRDPYLANVLATEAMNRTRRKSTIITTAGEGLLALDPEGRVTFVNPAGERMLGWTQAELLGEGLHELVHHHRANGSPFPASECQAMQVLTVGDTYRSGAGEVFWRKDGSSFPVAYTSSPIVTEGEVRGAVVVFRDVTEQEETQAQLRASEARTRSVLDAILGKRVEVGRTGGETAVARPHAPARGWLFRQAAGDINAPYERSMDYPALDRFTVKVLWLHAAALALLAFLNSYGGFARAFPSPFGWRELTVGQAVAAVVLGLLVAAAPTLTRGRLRSHYAWRLLTTVSLASFSALLIFVSGGSIEMHFHFFIVVALVAMWSDWRLGWVVLGLAALYHAVVDALAPGWVYFYGHNALSTLAHGIALLLAVGFTTVLCRKQRESVENLEAARGVLVGDLVARKRAEAAQEETEERLRALNETLETRVAERTRTLAQANRELEAFSDSVSHDLRAPLRAIEAMGVVLEEDYRDKLDADGQACLGRIRAESVRAAQMVNALLDLARAAQSDVRREKVDATHLAHEVWEAVRAKEPQRAATFTVAPGLVADADPRLLRVVLANLLGNAFKYSAKAPEAVIEMGALEEDGERVFFVRDNGAGFDKDKADRLFQPFGRLHAASEFEGTGVGLATVQRILTRHGGRAWAEGKVGQGATFYFTLAERTGPGV